MANRGFAAIGLHRPKCDGNVGGAIRAAGCYDARLVVVGGPRGTMKGRVERTDPRSTHRTIPVLWLPSILEGVPHECAVVAVEIAKNARPLPGFAHPERAFYIFGPEDGSIPNDIVALCDHVVMIPTVGCMNLAATVNVVLYDRMAKQWRSER